MKTVVCGASGYAGAELIKICTLHPELELVAVFADRSAGSSVGELHPGLVGVGLSMLSMDLLFSTIDELGVEVVFLALPHGVSQGLVPELLRLGVYVVDLGADFRLKDPDLYQTWYRTEHAHPELLGEATYGLVEFNRTELIGSRFIAAPGCYVTAASLAIKPLIDAGLAERDPVIVDAASGVSGAGRSPDNKSMFVTVSENFSAYGLRTHRHTVEIEENTSAKVLFSPHLAPMTRGILATCYMRPTELVSMVSQGEADSLIRSCYDKSFDGSRFVSVLSSPPSTRMTYGSNMVFVFGCYDERTNWIIAISALDNLVKGAAGQAVQALNVALGFDEGSGLSEMGVWP